MIFTLVSDLCRTPVWGMGMWDKLRLFLASRPVVDKIVDLKQMDGRLLSNKAAELNLDLLVRVCVIT